MIPLLVEYSEDDDAGCAFGAIVMIGVLAGSLLLLHRQQRVVAGRFA